MSPSGTQKAIAAGSKRLRSVVPLAGPGPATQLTIDSCAGHLRVPTHTIGLSLNRSTVMGLQRMVGNQEVQKLLRRDISPTIQRCGPIPYKCSPAEEAEHAANEGLEVAAIARSVAVSLDRFATNPKLSGRAQREADEQQESAALLAEPPTTTQLLGLGSSGEAVLEVQRALNSRGFGPLTEDGVFGPLTSTAVKGFQAQNGLDADGLVGPRTRATLLGTAVAPAEKEDGPCPPYSQAERKRSADSGGQVSDFGAGPSLGSALVFDFLPGRAEVRENHITFLKEIVTRFKLDDPSSPVEKINVIEGFTDCAGFAAGPEASAGINASLRLQRAIQVKLALDAAGAKFVNMPATPTASGAKGGPGDEKADLIGGRALNRSVHLELERKSLPPPGFPQPDGSGPGPGLCLNGTQSTQWELTSHVSGGVSTPGFGVGGSVAFFKLKDTKPGGLSYVAVFAGTPVGASTPEIQIAVPSATPFTTDPMCPGDFDGPALLVTKFSGPFVPGFPLGIMKGFISLAPTTKPPVIDIGSLQVGAGASVSAAPGQFTVIESLPF